jgi:hypothetical protein
MQNLSEYKELLGVFKKIANLDSSEEELIIASFKRKSIKKGEYFLKAGQINENLGFICKGLMRYFVYKNDEESTFEFTHEN